MFKNMTLITVALLFTASCGGVKTSGHKDDDALAGNDLDLIVSGDEDDPFAIDTVGDDTDQTGNDNAQNDEQNDEQSDQDIVSPTCGNGTVEGVELCDGTVDNCVDIDPYKYSSGKAKCLDNCTGWDTATCIGQDQCTAYQRSCIDSTHYAVCDDYDADGYTEWGDPLLCDGGGTCSGNGDCSGDCTSHYSYECASGDVYYFDSCGTMEDKKSECGASGYDGDPYCGSGHIYRNYVTRGCSGYSCTEDTSAELIETCTNGCTGTTCNPEKAATWYDSTSGLTWQNSTMTTTNKSGATTFCADLSLGGYSDWRLPTISELRSLVRSCTEITRGGACEVYDSCSAYTGCWVESDCGSCATGSGPSDTGMYWDADLLDTGSGFWSATVLSDSTAYSWQVNFTTGTLTYGDNATSLSVRCVRGTMTTYCGDGEVNGSEVCEGDDTTTCEAELGSSYTGTAYCATGCEYWDTAYCTEATLAAPATISASDGSYTSYVYVSWSSVTGADSYYLYRATSASGSYALLTASGTTNTYYTDYPPAVSTSYYYKVLAYDSYLGYSDYSPYDTGWCY
ncbi:MAG TPA: DUF1566 domain-containing protein [bacterium]|nr:DUF1566 domain-containing protein [bacterium]